MTISSVIDAHLLRDREDPATCNLSLKDICDRKKDIYGLPGTAVRRKVQNRDNYLKGVKKNDPSKYWQLVADARVKVKHPVSPTSAITDDEYEEEDDEDIPVASVVSVKSRTKPTKQSKRSSVKPSKRSPVKQPINEFRFVGLQYNLICYCCCTTELKTRPFCRPWSWLLNPKVCAIDRIP